jgi:hypothetical protein
MDLFALDRLRAMSAQPVLSDTTCDSYRRSARRLRAVHAGNPARLHRSLQELASRQARIVLSQSHVCRSQSFADRVRAEMDGPILRYSARQALLQRADSLGIGRFQANLIIAAIQHDVDGHRVVRQKAHPVSMPGWMLLGLCEVMLALILWLAALSFRLS